VKHFTDALHPDAGIPIAVLPFIRYANEMLQQAYDDKWVPDTPNSKNCSGFLKSAGRRLGFNLPDGRGDDILAALEQSPDWESLGKGNEALKKAIDYVKARRLVVVGATAHDYGQHRGHVAILLPKFGPNHAPLVYCGSEGGAASKGTKTIREVWRASKHDILRYFLHRTATLRGYE